MEQSNDLKMRTDLECESLASALAAFRILSAQKAAARLPHSKKGLVSGAGWLVFENGYELAHFTALFFELCVF